MELQAIFNCGLIGIGAVVMGISLVRTNRLSRLARSLSVERRERVNLQFTILRALMSFFLLGYVGAIVAIVMRYPLLSETFVSFIFLFGSVFVYLCVAVQLELLEPPKDSGSDGGPPA